MADSGTPAEDRGHLVVAPRVVERIASIAASEVHGVVPSSSALGRLTSRGLPRADAHLAGDRVRLAVTVAAAWPAVLGEVAGSVRDHVSEQVSHLAALQVDGVSVEIDDVVYQPNRKGSS